MRVTIHATIENPDGSSAPQVEIGEVTRDAGVDPASGLGLFVREANALLRQIQSLVLNEQADEFVRVAARCLARGRRLGIKDTKSLVYRTVYGKAVLRSPRFYSRCSACGFVSGDGATVSPLAHALKDRSHPQGKWYQCRYASVMSYRLAKIFSRDAFPGGKDLPCSSIKRNVGAIRQRLEREAKQATGETAYSFRRAHRLPLPARRWLSRLMPGTSRPAHRPTANAGSPSSPRSLSRAAPVAATPMLVLSDSDDGKECASRHSCNRSASLADPHHGTVGRRRRHQPRLQAASGNGQSSGLVPHRDAL